MCKDTSKKVVIVFTFLCLQLSDIYSSFVNVFWVVLSNVRKTLPYISPIVPKNTNFRSGFWGVLHDTQENGTFFYIVSVNTKQKS